MSTRYLVHYWLPRAALASRKALKLSRCAQRSTQYPGCVLRRFNDFPILLTRRSNRMQSTSLTSHTSSTALSLSFSAGARTKCGHSPIDGASRAGSAHCMAMLVLLQRVHRACYRFMIGAANICGCDLYARIKRVHFLFAYLQDKHTRRNVQRMQWKGKRSKRTSRGVSQHKCLYQSALSSPHNRTFSTIK